jgi:hypothetical protein
VLCLQTDGEDVAATVGGMAKSFRTPSRDCSAAPVVSVSTATARPRGRVSITPAATGARSSSPVPSAGCERRTSHRGPERCLWRWRDCSRPTSRIASTR